MRMAVSSRAKTVTFVATTALLFFGLAAARTEPRDPNGASQDPKPSKYLYVWAGAASATDKDSLFVVDVDKTSATYGEVVNVVATPYNGMEPHHCKITANNRYLGCGGLLSVLAPGPPPSLIFFDLQPDPRDPRVVTGPVAQPTLSAMADEFLPTPDGGFLVTMMGSAAGGSPGRVARYDSALHLVGEYPQEGVQAPPPGFNPHGIAAQPAQGTMLTCDFVEPASTLLSMPGPFFRPTVRLWDLASLTITHTYDLSSFGAGMMDAAPAGSAGYYFTGGNGFLFYLDPQSGAPPSAVFDFGVANPITILWPFREGARLIASQFALSKVFLFDTTEPSKPVLLDTFQLPEGAGAHVTKVSGDERIVAVSTYFLAEGPGGRVNLPGDSTVRLLFLDASGKHFIANSPTTKALDFRTIGGGFRPHGLAFF